MKKLYLVIILVLCIALAGTGISRARWKTSTQTATTLAKQFQEHSAELVILAKRAINTAEKWKVIAEERETNVHSKNSKIF